MNERYGRIELDSIKIPIHSDPIATFTAMYDIWKQHVYDYFTDHNAGLANTEMYPQAAEYSSMLATELIKQQPAFNHLTSSQMSEIISIDDMEVFDGIFSSVVFNTSDLDVLLVPQSRTYLGYELPEHKSIILKDTICTQLGTNARGTIISHTSLIWHRSTEATLVGISNKMTDKILQLQFTYNEEVIRIVNSSGSKLAGTVGFRDHSYTTNETATLPYTFLERNPRLAHSNKYVDKFNLGEHIDEPARSILQARDDPLAILDIVKTFDREALYKKLDAMDTKLNQLIQEYP